MTATPVQAAPAQPPVPSRLWRRLPSALLVALLAVVAVSMSAPPASADTGSEADLASRLNAERTARGLPALRVVVDLTQLAQAQAGREAAQDRMFHTENIGSVVPGWLVVAENVGYGPSTQALHDALMASAPHKANILDARVTQLGVGATWRGSRLYISEIFRKPDASTEGVPSLVPPVRMADLHLAACPDRVPSAGFVDVPPATTAGVTADCAAWWQVVRGVSPGHFAPDTLVTRAQVASLLARELQIAGRLPAFSGDYFTDDETSVHEGNINALARVGIVQGTAPGRFWPQGTLTRAQMATVLVRTQEYVLGTLPTAATPFTDVAGNVHATDIAKAWSAGLTSGVTGSSYQPNGTVPRRQVASFLLRSVDDLLTSGKVGTPG